MTQEIAELAADVQADEVQAGSGTGLVFIGVAAAPSDTTPPVVDNFSPANGATIQDTDPIFFDVTDDTGLFRRIIVAVTQGDSTELAHDGDGFLPPYATLSLRNNIADGFQYRLRRDGGWLDDATVRVWAIDESGNEDAA